MRYFSLTNHVTIKHPRVLVGAAIIVIPFAFAASPIFGLFTLLTTCPSFFLFRPTEIDSITPLESYPMMDIRPYYYVIWAGAGSDPRGLPEPGTPWPRRSPLTPQYSAQGHPDWPRVNTYVDVARTCMNHGTPPLRW